MTTFPLLVVGEARRLEDNRKTLPMFTPPTFPLRVIYGKDVRYAESAGLATGLKKSVARDDGPLHATQNKTGSIAGYEIQDRRGRRSEPEGVVDGLYSPGPVQGTLDIYVAEGEETPEPSKS